jgi:uncharacterized protein YndB with AHSA1/START domain
MPAVSMHFDVPPERVWEVLAEPRSYASWVPGTHRVGEVVGRWPERGATFRHTQGLPPLALSDTTTVLAADPPRRLELEARVRPLLVARVVVTVAPEPGGCEVTVDEFPVGGMLELPLRLLPSGPFLRLRVLEMVRRLRSNVTR